jgi:hypothetical protein
MISSLTWHWIFLILKGHHLGFHIKRYFLHLSPNFGNVKGIIEALKLVYSTYQFAEIQYVLALTELALCVTHSSVSPVGTVPDTASYIRG